MPKRPSRVKKVYRRDPLLPIDPERVRAAMTEQGWSNAQLARATRTDEQRLASLLRTRKTDRQPTARKSYRETLARALSAPSEFLAGEPVVYPHLRMGPDGYEYNYSSRTKLAATRLLTAVAAACERDLLSPASAIDPAREPWPPPVRVLQQAIAYVAELLQVGSWRHHLLVQPHSRLEARGFTEPATERPWTPNAKPAVDAHHEATVLALVSAVAHLLGPWFSGEARLNYRALRDLFHAPASIRGVVNESELATKPYAILFSPPEAP